MQSLNRRGKALLKVFAALMILALLTLFAANSPGYAAATDMEVREENGNVVLTSQAAKDLLLGLRTLRAENEVLTSSLESERQSAQELIAAVQQLRQEVQKERELSQQTIALLQKQIVKEKAKTRTVSIIGAAAVILALAL